MRGGTRRSMMKERGMTEGKHRRGDKETVRRTEYRYSPLFLVSFPKAVKAKGADAEDASEDDST